MKQRELFDLANFKSLTNPSKTLDDSLVKSYIFEIYPGQAKALSLPLTKTENYIGIFAAYRKLPSDNWKKVNKFAQNSIYLSSQQATRYFGKLPLRVVMRFVFFRSKLRGIRPLAIDISTHPSSVTLTIKLDNNTMHINR
ncbi:type VI secretion system lipoprotein TssJ [Piscirickettsia salmonis]|nr:type VI secretion system lipoprotein TssJ [Piscirickettsia salmonis]